MKNQIRLLAICFAAALIFCAVATSNITAQVATGGNYTLNQAVIASGGGQNAAGGNFTIDGTTGQTIAGGLITTAPFDLFSGFWTPELFAPSIQFSSATYSVNENGATASITVNRAGDTSVAVSVNYAASNGTATGDTACGGAGIDYQTATGTLNFAVGVSSQTFDVPICDDALVESGETLNLALSLPTGTTLGTPNTAVLTIVDNDIAPTPTPTITPTPTPTPTPTTPTPTPTVTPTPTPTATPTPMNTAPVVSASPNPFTVAENSSDLTVIFADDADGDNLIVTITDQPDNGSITPTPLNCQILNNANYCSSQVTYTPNPNFNGADSFSFKANDGQADSTILVINITVTPVANTLIVTKTADTRDGVCDADCSLREAIAAANPGDTIEFASPLFDSPQTIYLQSLNGFRDLVINRTLTINGKGANLLTINRHPNPEENYRIFNVNGSGVTVNLNNLTVTGGNSAGFNGGGINANGGVSLKLTHVHITGNSAGRGGGLFITADSSLTLTGSTVSANTAVHADSSGGGIHNEGVLNIINSTISGNIKINGSNNGGIWTSGTATITNSTITDNQVADVSSAGGIFNAGGSVTISSTIVAGNRDNSNKPDVGGAFISNGYNLVGNVGISMGFNQTSDQTGVIAMPLDPRLAALGDYGGTTPTHALLPESPAIEKGNSFGSTTDQRGLLRPVDKPNLPPADGGDNADIGAFEAQAATANTAPVVSASPNPVTVNEDSSRSIGIRAEDIDADNLTLIFTDQPDNGTITANPLSCGIHENSSYCSTGVTYTPNPNFNGTDSFSFKANDGQADSAILVINITVTPVNDNPDAMNDTATVAEDSGANTINVRANDQIIPDVGETLTVSSVTQGGNGTVAITGGGVSVSYTPNANFFGADSFAYTVSDGNGGSDSATVNVSVTAVNDPPTISGTTISRQQTAPGSVSTIATVADLDNIAGNLTVITTSVPTGVTVTGITNTGGTINATVTTACNAAVGANIVGLKVTDGSGAMATANLTVNVTKETSPPVINPIANIVVALPANSTATSTAVTFPLPTASDNCGGAVTVTTNPVSGSQFNIGTTIVNVTATDGRSNQAFASFTVTVQYRFKFFDYSDLLSNPDYFIDATAGSDIQIRFSLSGFKGNNPYSSVPVSQKISCINKAPIGAAQQIQTVGGVVNYNTSFNIYVTVWRTQAWAGTCRRLTLSLKDGTTQTLDFRLR